MMKSRFYRTGALFAVTATMMVSNAYALEQGAYLVSTSTSYTNPTTGKTSDGGSNVALGEGMARSVVGSNALLEVDGDKKYVTLRINLMSNMQDVKFEVGGSSVSATMMKSSSSNDFADYRFQMNDTSKTICIKAFVIPMDREVIFYANLDAGSAKAGNGDFVKTVKDKVVEKAVETNTASSSTSTSTANSASNSASNSAANSATNGASNSASSSTTSHTSNATSQVATQSASSTAASKQTSTGSSTSNAASQVATQTVDSTKAAQTEKVALTENGGAVQTEDDAKKIADEEAKTNSAKTEDAKVEDTKTEEELTPETVEKETEETLVQQEEVEESAGEAISEEVSDAVSEESTIKQGSMVANVAGIIVGLLVLAGAGYFVYNKKFKR